MYADFYGFRAEPFLLTPDHRCYFESAVHAQAMAHLTYGINRGEGFIVITGEIGAGKTTLVKRLCASIDPDKIVAAHVVTTMMAGTDLLRMVASAFGLDTSATEKSLLMLRLQEFFESTYRSGRRALLIVDEAQNLTVPAVEELRMLSNIQVQDAAPFQCFLVGQPEFRAIVARPELEQLRQRVIASYHLGPLNQADCAAYLMHRLEYVGWNGDPAFDPEAIDRVAHHSSGIPRKMNTICSRLMLLGFLDELHRFTAADVDRVAADLADEGLIAQPNTSLVASGQIVPPVPSVNDQGSITALHARVDNLEAQLARHERSFRRAALVAHDFLTMHRNSFSQDT